MREILYENEKEQIKIEKSSDSNIHVYYQGHDISILSGTGHPNEIWMPNNFSVVWDGVEPMTHIIATRRECKAFKE